MFPSADFAHAPQFADADATADIVPAALLAARKARFAAIGRRALIACRTRLEAERTRSAAALTADDLAHVERLWTETAAAGAGTEAQEVEA